MPDPLDLAALRTEYKRASLDERDVAADPFEQFARWFAAARASQVPEPNAMSLCTVDAHGRPSARIVLLKEVDARGFVFYTNTESQKGQELAANSRAALLFYWKTLNRQVRIRGPVEPVTAQEADAYFATRPKSAQIGAWASQQSRLLESRLAFEKAIALHGAKYALGTVPRPPHWSGYRILPLRMEFWHDRPFRLHDRIEFRRKAHGEPWTKVRMYP